jgi:hypothetical protein
MERGARFAANIESEIFAATDDRARAPPPWDALFCLNVELTTMRRLAVEEIAPPTDARLPVKFEDLMLTVPPPA